MTATANILMSMTVVGGDKSKLQFAAVAAAIVLVAKALNDARKDAEEFTNKWNALTRSQKDAALAMDSAGKGLVDTGNALESVIKLTQAGINPTAKLTSAIGRLATVEGQKLGETYEQIQTRVEGLTKSIALGQSRALKQYGIDLDNTEDLLLAQAEAMEKVIERAEGLEVQWRNVDDALAAFNNDYDTMVGLLWASVSSIEAVDGVLVDIHDGMSLVNETLAAGPGLITDFVASIDSLQLSLVILSGGLSLLVNDTGNLSENLARLKGQLKGLEVGREMFGESDLENQAAQAAALGLPTDTGRSKTAAEIAREKKKKTGGGGRRVDPLIKMLEAQNKILLKQESINALLFDAQGSTLAISGFMATINEELRDTLTFEQQVVATERERLGLLNSLAAIDPNLLTPAQKVELFAAELEHEQQMADFEKQRVEWRQTNAPVLTRAEKEELWAAELEHEQQMAELEMERIEWRKENDPEMIDKEFWDQKISTMETEFWQRKWALDMQDAAFEAELRQQSLILDQRAIEASSKAWEMGFQSRLGMAQQFFGIMALLSTAKSKELFTIGKVGAIAEAGVNTALGAIKAYQAMSGIPVIGPTILGPLAAGMVVAAGLVAINKIRKQKWGSTSGGGAGSFAVSSAGSVGGGAGSFGGGFGGAGAGGSGGTTIIQLNLDGEQIHETMVNANDKASQQGKSSFANA